MTRILNKLQLFILSLLLIQACSTYSQKEVITKKFPVSVPGNFYLSAKNHSPKDSRFTFNLKDRFFASTADIIGKIRVLAGPHTDSL